MVSLRWTRHGPSAAHTRTGSAHIDPETPSMCAEPCVATSGFLHASTSCLMPTALLWHTRPSCLESSGRPQHGRGLGSRWSSLICHSLATKSPVHDARRGAYGCSSERGFSTRAEGRTTKGPTFMELFAGISGFGVAARKRGLTCVYANENNPCSFETYQSNHCRGGPGISKVDSRSIEQVTDTEASTTESSSTMSRSSSPPPRATLLFAGFPCQPFSNQGKKEGLDCEKYGHLLYEIMKLLIYLRNPIVVLENVKSFANKEFGTMEVLYQEFEALGYHVSWHIYNSVDFNLAQNRERLFILAVRKDLATGPFECESVLRSVSTMLFSQKTVSVPDSRLDS
ncbi:S-adenosyl-L-methionine-dependent methyltransferase [Diaporthe sp. PMI_573]|nr:S-adenosyl-L-methionine-dependent methyltransferase [Diaporthaceae sp. PMI_573]